jgi:diguanylate cyclase (GGDEF)-like protein
MNIREIFHLQLDAVRRRLLWLACLLMVLPFGYLRYQVGVEYEMQAIFLLPILAATWYVGLAAGISVALLSVTLWLLSDLHYLHTFRHPWMPWLNEGVRLVVYLVFVALLARLRLVLERERRLARVDPLTQLYNRRAFYELGDLETRQARRNRHAISALFIDVDNFKQVNDTLGHEEGDAVLREVATVLRQHVRQTDILGRLGGDEFAVILPEAGNEAAHALAEHLRGYLMEAVSHRNWPVTFSMGIASFEQAPESLDDLVSCSDALMYEAKRGGKNAIRQKAFPETA